MQHRQVLIGVFTLFSFLSLGNPSDSLRADALFHRADTFLLFNRHDSSIFLFEQAFELYNDLGDWEGVVSSKNKISENLCAVFELQEALVVAEEALQIASDQLGEFHLERANALSNIGNVYYLTGQHERALELYNDALRITESVPHDDEHLYSAPTNLGIGNVYYGKLQYEEAFRYFKNALETNQRILGQGHPYVANSYLSLGNLYRNKGSYNLAKENYNTALDINLGVFGTDHPDVATTYVGIADIYKSSGGLEKALQIIIKRLSSILNFWISEIQSLVLFISGLLMWPKTKETIVQLSLIINRHWKSFLIQSERTTKARLGPD